MGFWNSSSSRHYCTKCNARLQSNRSQQPPVDEEFEGQYKSVKGGVGAAFTEGENWDGLKTQE